MHRLDGAAVAHGRQVGRHNVQQAQGSVSGTCSHGRITGVSIVRKNEPTRFSSGIVPSEVLRQSMKLRLFGRPGLAVAFLGLAALLLCAIGLDIGWPWGLVVLPFALFYVALSGM